MQNSKTMCHICGSKIKNGTMLPFCEACGADLLNPMYETTYKQVRTSYDGWDGVLIITNKRLLFIKQTNVSMGMFGVVGVLIGKAIYSKMHGPKIGFSIAPNTITSLELTKVGFAERLTMQINNGVQIKLGLNKKIAEEWKDAILEFNSYQV